jgi:predicted transcriptional regulator
MYKANVNCSVLKEYLDFLIQQRLVEEQLLHKRRNKTKIRYAVTERGKKVLRYFNEVNIALQIKQQTIPSMLY